MDGVGTTVAATEVSTTTSFSYWHLSWTAPTGAASYRIYFDTNSGGDEYFTSSANSYTFATSTGATAGTPPTTTTAYVNKLTASGNSWLLGGNVGIGTTGPAKLLELSSAEPNLRLTNTGGGSTWDIRNDAGTWYVKDASAGLVRLAIAPTTGNVGIGTTAPGEILDIRKATGNYTTMRLYSGTANMYQFMFDGTWQGLTDIGVIGRSTNSTFAIATNDLPRIVILGSGNVGIGTTVVGAKLHVLTSTTNDGGIIQNTSAGNGYSAPLFLAGTNAATTVSNVSIEALTVAGANADMYFRTGGTGAAGFGTTQMVIKNSGNVGIGTTGYRVKLYRLVMLVI